MKFIYKKFLTFFAVSLLFVVLFAFGSSAAFVDHEGNDVAASEVTDLTGATVSISLFDTILSTDMFSVYEIDCYYDSTTFEYFSVASSVYSSSLVVSGSNGIVLFNGYNDRPDWAIDGGLSENFRYFGTKTLDKDVDDLIFTITGGNDVSDSDLISFLDTYATVTLAEPPEVPTILDVVIALFTAVGEWISNAVTAIIPMFWDGEALTFVGVLVCAALAVSVSFLIINVISRFLNFRG